MTHRRSFDIAWYNPITRRSGLCGYRLRSVAAQEIEEKLNRERPGMIWRRVVVDSNKK